ncbi:MAG: NUDIX domain-containing protein [Spirochaetaceae bacterium]|jgi:ADP-ribose pyrophosphatase YjhB (NUDIX family)|nr:NUDIX domain-containing protein [Spirochaetaceae bacterium]
MKLIADGNKYFHVLARGVIIDKDYILVAKAKNANNTFLPGGHLEFNANLKKSLAREIMEEMGMDYIIDEYIGCVENQWTENNIVNQEINHIFIVDGINKRIEIKSKENHLEFYWIKIVDMGKENLLPESIRKIVESIYKNNKINYISEII